MANIGEVSATLKADIGQYVGPMQQAAQATQQVQASVEQATTALLKEGAAGQVAGQGLGKVETNAEALAKELAAAEGRLVQLNAAFQTLGIPAAGREFQAATANVAKLKAQLASVAPELAKMAQAGSQVAPVVEKITPAAAGAHRSLNQLRGSVTAIASSVAGVPGPVGNLASKLLMFGAGGAVTLAVTAGLGIVALAFTKLRENAVKENERVEKSLDDLVESYRQRTGAIQRENKENTQNQLKAAQDLVDRLERTTLAPTAIQRRAGITAPQVADPQALERAKAEVARLNTLLMEANDAIDEFNKPKVEGQQERTRAMRDAARALEYENELLEINARNLRVAQQYGATNLFGVNRDLQAAQALLPAAEAIAEARRKATASAIDAVRLSAEEADALERGTRTMFERVGILQNAKEQGQFKQSVLDIGNVVKDQSRTAIEAAQGVGQALSRAIGQGFVEGGKSLGDRILAVLKAALADAIAKTIETNIFKKLIDGLFGGSKDTGSSLLGSVVGAVTGGLFGAPSLPAVEAVSGGVPIIVPLDTLPRPMSPVEIARDAMHQAVWIETARAAQSNGVNLQPRFR